MDSKNQYEYAVATIKQAVEKSRYRAAKVGNAELLSLYYGIGKYVSENTRNGAWGTDAIKTISCRLKSELTGLRGFSESNIKNMRLFYIHECAVRAWDKYTLREYIKSGLYRKQGSLPNNFSETLSDAKFAVKATKAFKDNYLLDFINTENLGESVEDIDERIIENQIVNNIKDFIIRFGTDFIFMGNQYRIEVADEEMFIDLLFFNRELNCLVAVELKTGKFKPSYLGQLNTYLTILDDKVRKAHENPSVMVMKIAKQFIEQNLDKLNTSQDDLGNITHYHIVLFRNPDGKITMLLSKPVLVEIDVSEYLLGMK